MMWNNLLPTQQLGRNYVDNLVWHTCNVAHKCNMVKAICINNCDTQIGIILK